LSLRLSRISHSCQNSLEKPYPRAAIQTPLMAIANPIATGGQAVRNASTALATMTVSLLFNRGGQPAEDRFRRIHRALFQGNANKPRIQCLLSGLQILRPGIRGNSYAKPAWRLWRSVVHSKDQGSFSLCLGAAPVLRQAVSYGAVHPIGPVILLPHH